MVRSLAQWTKTLSFPARISPNKTTTNNKECSLINVHQITPPVNPNVRTSNNNMCSDSPPRSISPVCSDMNKINSMKNSQTNISSTMSEVSQVSFKVQIHNNNYVHTYN